MFSAVVARTLGAKRLKGLQAVRCIADGGGGCILTTGSKVVIAMGRWINGGGAEEDT